LFFWSLSTHHTHETQKKKGREREISSLFESEEEYFGEVQRSGRTSNTPRSPFFLLAVFSGRRRFFWARRGEEERERERFRLSHVEKDTFFLLREIFSRY